LPWKVAVDDLDGTVHAAYGMLADPSYLVGTDGRVAFYSYWTHVPSLRAAIEALVARGGAGVVGAQRALHPFAALADGWRAIERGLPQSFSDLETALPGLGLGLRAGAAIGPALAPVALTSHRWPRAVSVFAVAAALGAVVTWWLRRPPSRNTRWWSEARCLCGRSRLAVGLLPNALRRTRHQAARLPVPEPRHWSIWRHGNASAPTAICSSGRRRWCRGAVH
jgi:hypothetical protein